MIMQDTGLHENLCKCPTKLYMDIEIESTDERPCPAMRGYYKESIEDCKRVITKLVGHPEFILCECEVVSAKSKKYKYSGHLICKSHYINDDVRKLFGNWLKKVLSEESGNFLDINVYDSKVKLKLPNQLKKKDRDEGY